MGALYPYSLIPVLSVATLLFFTAARQAKRTPGLALFCLSVAVWSATLIMLWIPGLEIIGERAAAVGAFTAASYLHAAYDATAQRSYRLVMVAYLVAAAVTIVGIAWPGVMYGPRAMARGPLFWPAMGLSVVAASVPLVALARKYLATPPIDRAPLRGLFLAGVLSYAGGLSNALLLSAGQPSPFPMLSMLASLFLTAHVIRVLEPPEERRVLERSLLYAAVAAFLSAGFLFGVMQLVEMSPSVGLGQYRLSAFFLLCMAALAFEPLRQHLQEVLTASFTSNRASATHLARALTAQEARTEHAERLASLGALTSAVAHEVRNPLGVMTALAHQLSQEGANPETVAALKDQIGRASQFVEDLLAYGRPQPLEWRQVDVLATVQLAASHARQGLQAVDDHITIDVEGTGRLAIEGDQHQLLQAFLAIIDNALLAVIDRPKGRIRVLVHDNGDSVQVVIEDDGPGIPTAVASTLFQPFVTSRPRAGPRPGTGLGLSIAAGIVERHRGTIGVDDSPLGGASFAISLPRQPLALAPQEAIDAQGIPP